MNEGQVLLVVDQLRFEAMAVLGRIAMVAILKPLDEELEGFNAEASAPAAPMKLFMAGIGDA
jgi:hypothetical protein